MSHSLKVTMNSEMGNGAQKKRILLVDDEAEVADASANALRGAYTVVTTTSPFEALAIIENSQEPVDMVICDYYMPGMNGAAFVDKIRKLGIHTPTLLYTGKVFYQEEHLEKKFTKILQKPFSAAELRVEVAAMLDAPIKDSASQIKKLSPATDSMEASLLGFERFLQELKIDAKSIDPSRAKDRLGSGEAYQVFMAWHHMRELLAKMR